MQGVHLFQIAERGKKRASFERALFPVESAGRSPPETDNGGTHFFSLKNMEKASETMVKQLSKLGGSEFFAETTAISEDFDIFLPVSEINEIRRNLISQLEKVCEENYVFQRRNTDFQTPEYPYKKLDYSFNVSNEAARRFFEKAGCEVLEYAPECGKKEHLTLMKTKHCLRHYAGICLKDKPDDKRQFVLVDEMGAKYRLEFDCKNCVMKIKV